MDAHVNFSLTTVSVAPSPASSGTTLDVVDPSVFPVVPFNATVAPASASPTSVNAEIVRVTNITGTTLTVIRQQEGTSARTIVVGDKIAATITVKTITDIEESVSASVPQIWPGANFRFKDGQLQYYDAGYAAIDSTKPWVAYSSFNGILSASDPIAD